MGIRASRTSFLGFGAEQRGMPKSAHMPCFYQHVAFKLVILNKGGGEELTCYPRRPTF